MKNAVILLVGLLVCDCAFATGQKTLVAPPGFRQNFAKHVVVRTTAPVVTTPNVAPGQAGYVHYFLIRNPDDGEEETQVGIELADQRIAWSFPELGVVVSPFIKSGPFPVNGKVYEVQHLYGLRPFPDEPSMATLRRELMKRVIPWVDDAVPYCWLRPLEGDLCVNCLGFVMRMLFPGATPNYPALPRDFKRKGPDAFYTTEDMLLYLAGLHGYATQERRLKRIAQLTLPSGLREDLIEIVKSIDPNDGTGLASVASSNAVPLRAIVGKNRARTQSLSKSRQPAVRPSKPL